MHRHPLSPHCTSRLGNNWPISEDKWWMAISYSLSSFPHPSPHQYYYIDNDVQWSAGIGGYLIGDPGQFSPRFALYSPPVHWSAPEQRADCPGCTPNSYWASPATHNRIISSPNHTQRPSIITQSHTTMEYNIMYDSFIDHLM